MGVTVTHKDLQVALAHFEVRLNEFIHQHNPGSDMAAKVTGLKIALEGNSSLGSWRTTGSIEFNADFSELSICVLEHKFYNQVFED